MDPEFITALKNMSPEKRIATTDDVAQAVGFLAEDGSRWVNGASIPVTGAAVMF
jgi:NAD(P)-dependent dehydrogenase (short-subunit alcohol dehydrogenase family)